MIEISIGKIQEIPIIQALAYQIWPLTFDRILSKDQIKFMLYKMYNHNQLEKDFKTGQKFIVARQDQSPVGFACYEHSTEPGFTKLHKLYVLPKLQGKGTGKKLVEYVISEAKVNGLNRLRLNVNRNNLALHFYEKLGFVNVREENIPIGGGYWMEDFVMELLIL